MKFGLIGAPTSVGSHHAGQEDAPAAVRAAGLVGLLEAGGHEVVDHGDISRHQHRASPAVDGYRAVPEVARMLAELVPAITAVVDAGQVPLVLGGDCTISLGVLAAVAARRPHLMYVDGDADLGLPPDSSGVLDATGIAHLLGKGAPELLPFVRTAGLGPARDVTLFGTNSSEVDEDDRALMAEHGLTMIESATVAAAPEAVAAEALERIPADQPLVLHLDVDVLDSGELAMANYPHFGGLSLDAWGRAVSVLSSRPLAAVVLTEINPHYDPSGQAVHDLVTTLAAALSTHPGQGSASHP